MRALTAPEIIHSKDAQCNTRNGLKIICRQTNARSESFSFAKRKLRIEYFFINFMAE